ncbi:protein REGULATOR OF FATTY ACID COMPOSITION 3, chloroplastic-like [Malania oleifera]|uniref:protein REGULATOR OF FATTY ACID COMPOSITION 3, chloroplastic-like n=1 Tax=Malania oleifera TaxID=397392 RepID=UPI0025ADFA2D|nr:protein REGULATOR OF FATTY ACID COMPOSITION 3, chloroplastic-like [Malania oleifera]
MEAFVRTSSLANLIPNFSTPLSKQKSCLISATGLSTPWSASPQKPSFLRKSLIADAKKNKKADTHSFVPRPDEATGPFPEAVLLKEKKVQEDGRILPEFADAEEAQLFEYLQLQLESDLNVERIRHYEVVYLIHENHAEEAGSVNEKVQEFLREKKGKIWRLNDWGLRRLAYKIRKARKAHYMLMNFELEAKWINDFKSMLDKDERVIRHLVMKRDEAITKDCPPPPEFHTLRGHVDEEDDIDYDDEYDDEDDEDWDDQDEIDLDDYDDNDVEDDFVSIDAIDDDGEDGDDRNNELSSVGSLGGRNLKAEKLHEL